MKVSEQASELMAVPETARVHGHLVKVKVKVEVGVR